ncbi:hypothetical protein M413DRAFT_14647 [Hebeloma cylindrosporum]|uniref:Uncharacterized protein n=1 Tax=Hebeloma cylindrosporum TaxID=76867 RepID=A0A0C3BT76_HEBCY|nr:hypothetical protein M413DRAFT_14647 [Hebeloma cylindrosporum h7]
MYNAPKKCLMTPTRQSTILDARLLKQQGYAGKGLPCPRISASTVNFVRLIDAGFTVDSLQPVKLWVPDSLLPPGLVIQGHIRLKKRARKASRVGGEKRRKVTSRESSTECLEKPESSSMGSAGYLDCSQGSEGTSKQVLFPEMEGGDECMAIPWFDREVIDLTEEGEDEPKTLGGMDVRSARPRFDGEAIDLTEEGEAEPKTLGGIDGDGADAACIPIRFLAKFNHCICTYTCRDLPGQVRFSVGSDFSLAPVNSGAKPFTETMCKRPFEPQFIAQQPPEDPFEKGASNAL